MAIAGPHQLNSYQNFNLLKQIHTKHLMASFMNCFSDMLHDECASPRHDDHNWSRRISGSNWSDHWLRGKLSHQDKGYHFMFYFLKKCEHQKLLLSNLIKLYYFISFFSGFGPIR